MSLATRRGRRRRRAAKPEQPVRPESASAPPPTAVSFAEKVRTMMLGLGNVAIEIAAIGTPPDYHYGVDDHRSEGDSPPARTWYGRLLQWAWAILVFLFGLAALIVALVLAVLWVLSWFA